MFSDFEFKTEHTRLIQQNYLLLLEELDPRPLLLGHLFANGVIDDRQKEEIGVVAGRFQQNERLLSIISRKSTHDFCKFLTALRESGQKHVAFVLSKDGGILSFAYVISC